MSKSQWNSVAPSEITKKYGADILRLWSTSVDYQADCSMGQNILKQVAENYRKVRNTFRFLMANLDNNTFTKENLVPVNELSKLNQYILVKLNEVIRASIKAYNEYRFADVVSMLTNFMTNELSAYYLDYTKDILYIENVDDPERRQVQTVLYLCLDALTRLWAPILVHTCEEINDFMHFDEESIHLAAFKEIELDIDERSLLDKMQRILLIRKDVLKALEIARNAGEIKKSLEAHLVMSMDEEDQKIFDELVQNPAQWLIVSKVDFVKADLPAYENCQIEVKKRKDTFVLAAGTIRQASTKMVCAIAARVF